jgi:hypothetical protein
LSLFDVNAVVVAVDCSPRLCKLFLQNVEADSTPASSLLTAEASAVLLNSFDRVVLLLACLLKVPPQLYSLIFPSCEIGGGGNFMSLLITTLP